MNLVLLEGVLSSPVVVRSLPSGSVLCSLEVTTRDAEGAAASVPVAWFDPPVAPGWVEGTAVVVFGTVRRRFFRGGAVTQSRTEVLAELVAAASDKRATTRVLGRARDALSGDRR